ncbi:hypothetical protein CR513_35022, partial [Mucuna pruriens]
MSPRRDRRLAMTLKERSRDELVDIWSILHFDGCTMASNMNKTTKNTYATTRNVKRTSPSTTPSTKEFQSITSPWSFSIWEMDILGPFPMAKGQVKFILVAVDYFTKWIKVEPLATITT